MNAAANEHHIGGVKHTIKPEQVSFKLIRKVYHTISRQGRYPYLAECLADILFFSRIDRCNARIASAVISEIWDLAEEQNETEIVKCIEKHVGFNGPKITNIVITKQNAIKALDAQIKKKVNLLGSVEYKESNKSTMNDGLQQYYNPINAVLYTILFYFTTTSVSGHVYRAARTTKKLLCYVPLVFRLTMLLAINLVAILTKFSTAITYTISKFLVLTVFRFICFLACGRNRTKEQQQQLNSFGKSQRKQIRAIKRVLNGKVDLQNIFDKEAKDRTREDRYVLSALRDGTGKISGDYSDHINTLQDAYVKKSMNVQRLYQQKEMKIAQSNANKMVRTALRPLALINMTIHIICCFYALNRVAGLLATTIPNIVLYGLLLFVGACIYTLVEKSFISLTDEYNRHLAKYGSDADFPFFYWLYITILAPLFRKHGPSYNLSFGRIIWLNTRMMISYVLLTYLIYRAYLVQSVLVPAIIATANSYILQFIAYIPTLLSFTMSCISTTFVQLMDIKANIALLTETYLHIGFWKAIVILYILQKVLRRMF